MISADTEQTLPSFDFNKEKKQIDDLISEWGDEERKCKDRSELRQNKKSTSEERLKGTIPKDGTIIPDRTIASNIRRSKVPYTNYVTQSKRILIITDTTAPSISIEPLELWFTRGMRYPGWKSPWFRLIDAFHVHGGAALEVVYDPDNPMNVGLEYIPRDELIIPRKTRNLQACPRIIRKYEMTSIQLEEFTNEFNFDPSITKELLDKHLQGTTSFISVYRVLLKVSGVVYNAWYSKDCDKYWLREPIPHDIGLFTFDKTQIVAPVVEQDQFGQPVSTPLMLHPYWQTARAEFMVPQTLSAYPIFWFSLQETECDEILDEQGRASMDLNVQEAMMRLLTNTVNASTRASSPYPCVENTPGEDPKLEELGPIKPDVIMSRKILFNQFPWPNSIILAVQQALKIGKADESGQTDYAATARKDANKTAKELELATEQASLVISADLDVFSSAYLQAEALAFVIACHQAIFLLCDRPPHPELLLGDYNLQSASDTEVVKRAEDKQNAKEFFNIVQGTPAAEKILKFLIQRFFPDQADEWLAELATPDLRGVIAMLLSIIQNIPQDELPPQQRLELNQIIATTQQLVGGPNNTAVLPGAPGPAAGAVPAGNAMQ